MEFYLKLPRNKGEFLVFMAIVSIISVNILAPLITCFEAGFRMEVWGETLGVLPWIWLAVIASVSLTLKPAEFLASKIVSEGDSFGAHILANVLCTVFLMSILLTVLGPWIGTGRVSTEPLRLFFHRWPRNFALAFAVEALIAQPAARIAMEKMHLRLDARQGETSHNAKRTR